MCSNQDPIDHTFFECQATLQFCDHSISWFNAQHKSNVELSNLQFFLNLYQPPAHISSQQNKKCALLLICAKQYVYARKSMQKSPNFIRKSGHVRTKRAKLSNRGPRKLYRDLCHLRGHFQQMTGN